MEDSMEEEGAYLPFLLLTELGLRVCMLVTANFVVEVIVIIAGGGGGYPCKELDFKKKSGGVVNLWFVITLHQTFSTPSHSTPTASKVDKYSSHR